MKSLVLMLFSLSIFTLQFNTSYSQSKRSEPVKIYFDGEVYSSHYNPGNIKNATIEKIDNVKVYNSISFINLAVLRNYYDTQSNGTPVQIWQDPANPNNIHAVYTYSSQPTGWSDRTIQYFFSSDKGTTWSFIGNVPTTGRAGFPTITGLSNGIPIIGCHTNTGASTLVRTQFFVDAFPGLGSFTNLNPGASEDSKYIWPRVIATQNTSLANKFIFISSTSNTTFDSCFWNNSGTSVTSSIFTGYKKLNTASAAESYAIGCGILW